VDTAGNLGGLYEALGQDPRYFRVVNLADPAFEARRVYFQLDNAYVESFQDTVNLVSVNLRKTYPGQPAFTGSIRFGEAEIKAGKTFQELVFPRLGQTRADWPEYELQVRWSLRDGTTMSVPAKDGEWLRQSDPAVSLTPPFEKRVIEIDADRQLFAAGGVTTAVVDVATMLGGRPMLKHRATLRATDAESVSKLVVYHDRATPVALRVSWHSPTGKTEGKLNVLDGDYVFLAPPAAGGGGTP
jgi:hypothetical protein